MWACLCCLGVACVSIPYVRICSGLAHLFLWGGRNIPEASPNLGGEGFRRLEFGYVVFFNDDGCVLRYVSTYFSGSFPDREVTKAPKMNFFPFGHHTLNILQECFYYNPYVCSADARFSGDFSNDLCLYHFCWFS